MEILLI